MSIQLSLDFHGIAFPDGAIVVQASRWIGNHNTIYPYWQVRYSEELKDRNFRRLYYCHAVPYGHHPGELWWFEEGDIVDTGLCWRVPSHDELEQWCLQEHHTNSFLAHLNRGIHFHCWHHPYSHETELVKMLETLSVPWQYGKVARYVEEVSK